MLKNFHGHDIARQSLAFIFIFAPNNSGTTVMAQYLAEQADAFLPPTGNHEGQALPGVREIMSVKRRWNSRHKMDWPRIRHAWEEASGGRLFIESSPPNLMRVDAIATIFGADSAAMLAICDPYQQVASCLRRYHKPGGDVAMIAGQWVKKATTIRELQVRYPSFPLLRYDDFVADPASLNRLFGLPVRPSQVRGKKGSGAKAITDMRPVTTLFLTPDEIDHLTDALAPHAELVAHFGYRLGSSDEIVGELTNNPGALDRAQRRRARWAARPG